MDYCFMVGVLVQSGSPDRAVFERAPGFPTRVQCGAGFESVPFTIALTKWPFNCGHIFNNVREVKPRVPIHMHCFVNLQNYFLEISHTGPIKPDSLSGESFVK